MSSKIKYLFIITLLFQTCISINAQQWQQTYTGSTGEVVDLSFHNPQVGVISKEEPGGVGKVYITYNKGATWSQIWQGDLTDLTIGTDISSDVIQTANGIRGLVYCDGKIWKTDNGINWNIVYTLPTTSMVYKIKFVNENTAYALFTEKNINYVSIYKSIDGGNSWFLTVINNQFAYSQDNLISDISFSDIDNQTLFVCGRRNSGYTLYVIKTTDGFTSWNNTQIIDLPNEGVYLNNLDYISVAGGTTNEVGMQGFNGIYKYLNNNFQNLIPGYQGASNGITLSNSNLGFMSRSWGSDIVFKTTNGCYNWVNDYVLPAGNMSYSGMSSYGDVAYLGGKNGIFFTRRIPVNIKTNYDWNYSLSGSIKLDNKDGQGFVEYITPASDVYLRGGWGTMKTDYRFTNIIPNQDTNSIFYYWGTNGSLNWNGADQYYINEHDNINADYKTKLISTALLAINKAASTKCIKDAYGRLNLVYESMDGIWFTKSKDANYNFKMEECVSDWGMYNYKSGGNSNPSITEMIPWHSSTEDPDRNMFITYEQRNGSEIIIHNSFRNNLQGQEWHWGNLSPDITISGVTNENFKALPKTVVAQHYGQLVSMRLLTCLEPIGNHTRIRARTFYYSDIKGIYTIAEGISSQVDITDFTMTASLRTNDDQYMDIFISYKLGNSIMYYHGVLHTVGTNVTLESPEQNISICTNDNCRFRYTPVLALRNISSSGTEMQPVAAYSGQYTVRIYIDNGDGGAQPYDVTYYPIVVSKRNAGGWVLGSYRIISTSYQVEPDLMGSKQSNSFLINFKRDNTYYQTVLEWGEPVHNYYCYPASNNSRDAKFIQGGLIDNNSTTQYLLTLNQSSNVYQLNKSSFEITNNAGGSGPPLDAVNAIVVNDNIKYSFNLGSIMVNSNEIGFDTELDTNIADMSELNDNLCSENFLLNENDTLVVGRIASYVVGDSNSTFSDIEFKVNLVNNTTGNIHKELVHDTVHVWDTIQVEYLTGYIITGIEGGSDSFYVAMEIDTLFLGDGYGAGGDEYGSDGGDKPPYKKFIFWENQTVKQSNNLPTEFALYQNLPNPFNPVTKIKYDLPKSVKVTVKVYDIIGREVTTLINNEFKNAGRYQVEWNAQNYASGVYIYRIEAGDYTQVKKMVLVK